MSKIEALLEVIHLCEENPRLVRALEDLLIEDALKVAPEDGAAPKQQGPKETATDGKPEAAAQTKEAQKEPGEKDAASKQQAQKAPAEEAKAEAAPKPKKSNGGGQEAKRGHRTNQGPADRRLEDSGDRLRCGLFTTDGNEPLEEDGNEVGGTR